MSICAVCDKKVWFAEKIFALNQIWHKTCFKCRRCNKVLQLGQHVDNDRKPYCKPCHSKCFGPKGMRGAIVMDNEHNQTEDSRCTSGEIDNSSRSFKNLRSMFEK